MGRCAGMNLANVELRLHLGTVLRQYEIRAPAYTNRETLVIDEFFLSAPKGHKLDLIFVKTQE
jgi:cytochrome P450